MDTMYFVETTMNNGHKMSHQFMDFLDAISICKQFNLKNVKSMILSEKGYNGYNWYKQYLTEEVDMLDLLIDNKIGI